MNQLSQKQLLSLLYEKDCYIKALEQQLEICQNEIQLLKKQKKIIQNYSSDEDCNLDENSEPAISDSRVEQFQSSGKKIKFKSPLKESNSKQCLQQSKKQQTKCLQQKILESFEVNANTILENQSINNNKITIGNLFILGLEQKMDSIPKVLFSSCKGSQLEVNGQIESVINFIFPEGCKQKVIPTQYSIEDINLSLNQEFQFQSQNTYLIITKSQEYQQITYYHCYRYTDYTILDGDTIRFSKRAICLSTNQFQADICFEIIVKIMNQLQKQRQTQYTITKNLSLIDTQYFDLNIRNTWNSQIEKFITEKNIFGDLLYKSKIFSSDKIEWGLPIILSKFDSVSLIKLFVSSLIEKSIVFISKSPQFITAACLLCYRYLLKPFSWIHPVICNLPLSALGYLGSPVPILAGIECSYDVVINFQLIQKFPNSIFINLDNKNQIEFGNIDAIPLVSADLMNFLQQKIQNAKNQYNATTQIQQILAVFSQLLQNRVIKHIPTLPILQENNPLINQKRSILDYEKIALRILQNMGTLNSDRFLWKQFFQTQVFIQFIEQYYH